MTWVYVVVFGVLPLGIMSAYLFASNARLRRCNADRGEVERELKESEERLQCFFDAAFEGLAVVKDLKIVDCNKRFARVFHMTPKEAIGQRVMDYVHPEDKELVKGNIESMYKKPYQHRIIINPGEKEEEVRYVEVQGKPTMFQGADVRMTAINDITDKKKAEEELVKVLEYQNQTSKLEAIGNFASGIAHDFNNALTPIIGNCELILQSMPLECQDNCEYRVNTIMAAAETASLLVSRMQAFTRSNGSIESTSPLRIANCLIDTFEFLRSILPASIELETYIEDNLRVVSANEVTLRQVLMNLCKNAAQSMTDEEGSITISVSNDNIMVERFGLKKGEYVIIAVEDDGDGMTPYTLQHALDPYFTTKVDGEGTGLGLSVVDTIVRGYGGIVRIYSEVDNGTRVVLYIPSVEDTEAARECKIMSEIVLGNNEEILLVDDEEYVLEAVISVVESLNYTVTSFTSSIEALEEFKQNPDKYDAIVTDLTMPGLSGITLISEMRKIRPEVKVILCSGLGNNGKSSALMGDPIDGYLAKPVTRGDYSEALAKIFKRANT